MPISPPPGYWSVDEMFARVGLEVCGREWTGKEAGDVSALGQSYWRDPDDLPRVDLTRLPAGFSAEDLEEHFRCKEAIKRHRTVVKRIIDRCRNREYLAFSLQPGGEFSPIDANGINSESFQTLLCEPLADERERLYFVLSEDFEALGQEGLDGENESLARREHDWARLRTQSPEHVGSVVAGDPPAPTRREQSMRETDERHQTWRRLADTYRITPEGRKRSRSEIAKKVAADPEARGARKKAPKWPTVVRELNRSFPGWAE